MKKLFTLASLIALGCTLLSGAVRPLSAATAAMRQSNPADAATTRASVSTTGQQGDRDSYAVGLSADGRYLAFASDATNLVAGDSNGKRDAFVHDRLTGRTTRVSVSSSGAQARCSDPLGCSDVAGISADGRYVVFVSNAANLVPRDTNRASDVFVHDLKTGRTTRVSVGSRGRQGNGSSGSAAISADGRYVAFSSSASNLVAGDTNHATDVFVRDLKTGRTTRVSLGSRRRQTNRNSESTGPALSAHGRYVAFTSNASNLVAGDTNGLADVFVHDLKTGRTTRVSVSSSGTQAVGDPTRNGSNAPSISADGRYVAFHSATSNLVPGDSNRVFDIFIRDRKTGRTTRVSVSTGGAQANAESLGPPSISPDGRYVAFASLATNLVAGDGNDITDVFVRDLRANRTTVASLSGDGAEGNDGSAPAVGAFSADDRYLAFSSWAANLVPGDTNRCPDAFVRLIGDAPKGFQAASATPAGKQLAAHQEPREIGNLVAPGDRVQIVYTVDTQHVRSASGTLYVRNDLQRRFTRLGLKLRGSSTLQASVPERLIRGQKLFYYAVLRGAAVRPVTLPARGAAAPRSAYVLSKAVMVRLGTHRFGHLRAPDAVVARARAGEVGFENDEFRFGPQTFLVGRDRSIWLHDSVDQRLLVWGAGEPNAFARSVALPFFAGDDDIALGPAGSIYTTRTVGHGLSAHGVVVRLDANGRVLWENRLSGSIRNDSTFIVGAGASLRVGPDGTLYCLAGMNGLPGGEFGWMPVATPAGRPLSPARQRHGTDWPYQPVAGGLRLVSEVYTAHEDTAPHEVRFALVDRRGRVVRAWRVLSQTDINLNRTTPALVGGDLAVVLDATAQSKGSFKWEYVALRLGRHGARAQLSLAPAVWGESALADVRIGPDGALYQLTTSPASGVTVSRYSLAPTRAASRHDSGRNA